MFFSPELCYKALSSHYSQRLEEETARLRKEMDFHLRHTKGVLSICWELAGALPEEQRADLDPDLLSAAALLHDVAKFDGPGEHNRTARQVIAEHLDLLGWDAGREGLPALAGVIEAHRGPDFQPGEAWAREAAILRLADKIDMRRRGMDKKEQYKDSRKLIRRYFQSFPDGSGQVRFLAALLDAAEAASNA